MKKGYYTRKKLIEAYDIHRNTFARELEKVPGLKSTKGKHIFSPLETQKIFKHLGDPFQD
jgi:hypothetical protein